MEYLIVPLLQSGLPLSPQLMKITIAWVCYRSEEDQRNPGRCC